MKLAVVHTYQSVRFNKRDETHFTSEKPNMVGLQMEYDEKLLVVKITLPGQDSILVFPTNISYAQVSKAESEVAKPDYAPKAAKTESAAKTKG